MSGQTRVGVVDYLNSRPLAWDFLCGRIPPGFEVTYCSPARVADGLREGRLDIGLVPSIEVQRIPGLRVLSGPCVAAQQEARSVLLVAKVPPRSIRRVALDENSRTSAALVRILLADAYDCEPDFVSSRPVLGEMLSTADAALIIGDPALEVSVGEYTALDLAREWRSLTGLPFVFAVWAVRDGVPLEEGGRKLARIFAASLESGVRDLARIAQAACEDLAVEADELLTYLSENLSYELGEAERRSLDEFYRRAARFGLIEKVRELEFVG